MGLRSDEYLKLQTSDGVIFIHVRRGSSRRVTARVDAPRSVVIRRLSGEHSDDDE